MSVPSRRVVITGAAGNLGSKLRRHLEERDDLELVLLDLRAGPGSGIVEADLAEVDQGWRGLFRKGDVVVHLAAEASPMEDRWPRLQARNVDAMLNVYEAAARAGCSKMIFASSMRVFEGYRYADEQVIAPDAEPWPETLYAVTKVFGERVGRMYGTERGLPVVCLRIGVVRPGRNTPPSRRSAWNQATWLSDGDFCAAVEKAIDAEITGFVQISLTSRVAGGPVDVETAYRAIGSRPRDAWNPDRPTWRAALRHRLAARIGPLLQRVLLRLRV